jgi:hypothetical protein
MRLVPGLRATASGQEETDTPANSIQLAVKLTVACMHKYLAEGNFAHEKKTLCSNGTRPSTKYSRTAGSTYRAREVIRRQGPDRNPKIPSL